MGAGLLGARAAGRALLAALNRWTGAASFPLAGPALLALAGLCLLARDRRRALRRLALALAVSWAALWLPGMSVPAPPLPEPGADALQALCEELVRALDAGIPSFPAAEVTLARAPAVAGLPGGRVKAAAFPRGLRALRTVGVAVPWTGEALVDAGAHPALLPFVAVHELMHIAGIPGEGRANIAAWERCDAAGGAFAASARLWALRYAAGLLAAADGPRCASALAGMSPGLAALWEQLGGVILPEDAASLLGSYGDLARWLASRP